MEQIQVQINTNVIWLRLKKFITLRSLNVALGSVVMWLHPL